MYTMKVTNSIHIKFINKYDLRKIDGVIRMKSSYSFSLGIIPKNQ